MAFAVRSAIAAAVAYVLLTLAVETSAWSDRTENLAAGNLNFWTQETLLGDMGGLRPWLDENGAELAISETSEVLGNVTGGLRRGGAYEGLTDISLRVDLRRTLAWPGVIFARAYQIHGRGLSANNIGNLYPVSGIEAQRTTRLNELWYEQRFETWRLRVGQLAVGDEFLAPEAEALFGNSGFGWPPVPSVNLPSGGPSYPLATPGVRLRVAPAEGLTLFLSLFNGDPTGAGVGGSQLADASGTAFRTSDGAFVIGQIRYNPEGSDKNGTYGVGGWWHSERFPDQRFDMNRVSLASPLSSGTPLEHNGNFSLFAWAQQPLAFDDAEKPSLVLFARVMGSPADRNLLSFYGDAGLIYKGPFGRAGDEAGIAFGYAHIGAAARGFDADVARFTGQPFPMRSAEILIEVTYRLQLTPWWQLQPDFQYVINPSGGILDPNRPGRRLGDAAVFGLRTTVTF
jgi:porin